jgi:hypothetical protein
MSKWKVTFVANEYRSMEVEADDYESAIATADRNNLTTAQPDEYDCGWYAQMIKPDAVPQGWREVEGGLEHMIDQHEADEAHINAPSGWEDKALVSPIDRL